MENGTNERYYERINRMYDTSEEPNLPHVDPEQAMDEIFKRLRALEQKDDQD